MLIVAVREHAATQPLAISEVEKPTHPYIVWLSCFQHATSRLMEFTTSSATITQKFVLLMLCGVCRVGLEGLWEPQNRLARKAKFLSLRPRDSRHPDQDTDESSDADPESGQEANEQRSDTNGKHDQVSRQKT